MATITTRAAKGSALTHNEVDDNFANLNSAKLEFGQVQSAGTANGVPYLNDSKLVTIGAVLTFDGTILSSTRFAGALNGTVGATTASTGAFTTLTTSSTVTLNGGTANGVTYLNGSKVLTSGTALTFDSSERLIVGGATAAIGSRLEVVGISGQAIGIRGRVGDGVGIISWHANAAATEYARITSDTTESLQFGVGASGSEAMRLTSTGLGIGTSSPDYLLTVGTAGATANAYIQIASTTTGSGNLFFGDTAGTGGGSYRGYLQYDHNSDAMVFGTSATDRMRLDSSGNLTLGAAAAGTNRFLYINGVVNKAGAIGFQESGVNKWLVGNGAASENGNFEIYDAVNGNNLVFNHSGNLGLGVTPSAWFSIYKAMQLGTYGAAIAGQTNDQALSLWSNAYPNASNVDTYVATSAATKYRTENGAHVWYNAPSGTAGAAITFTQAMTLDASGNLLVGTTVVPVGNRTNGHYFYADGGYNSRTVASKRDWGISVTSGAIVNFYSDNGSAAVYAGSINVNGNVTSYTSVSDYRLKENVVPMSNALANVMALNPVTYTFKNGGQSSQGFIAHELQAVMPECVTGEKDAVKEDGSPAYQGVDTSFLVATLTSAIQEQQALITSLIARVASLESK